MYLRRGLNADDEAADLAAASISGEMSLRLDSLSGENCPIEAPAGTAVAVTLDGDETSSSDEFELDGDVESVRRGETKNTYICFFLICKIDH